MTCKRIAIVLLKDDPCQSSVEERNQDTSPFAEQQQQQHEDPYRHHLLQNLLSTTDQNRLQIQDNHANEQQQQVHKDHVSIDYIPPLTTIFPRDTELNQLLLNTNHNELTAFPPRELFAFVVTSQNAVRALKQFLDDKEVQDGTRVEGGNQEENNNKTWRNKILSIPMYCLGGATLTSVQQLGFKTINPSTFSSTTTTTAASTLPTPGNASQLADLILSSILTVTSVTPATGSDPINDSNNNNNKLKQLWFLTGETHMKTLSDRFELATTATNTSSISPYNMIPTLREIVVYKTDQRPGIEQEIEQWIHLHYRQSQSTSSILWIVGFSPRGIEIVAPVVEKFIKTQSTNQQQQQQQGKSMLRWAAIGTTTGNRIKDLFQGEKVAVAASPKPESLAVAIRQDMMTSSMLLKEN